MSIKNWLAGRIKKVKPEMDKKLVDELSRKIAKLIFQGSVLLLVITIGVFAVGNAIKFILSPKDFSLNLIFLSIDLLSWFVLSIAGAIIIRYSGPKFWNLLGKLNSEY